MILSGSLGSSCVLSAELEGAVLDGFGDVLGADGLAAGQVRDGPGDLQHAVIAPRRHAERVEGLLHEHGAVLVQLAEPAQLRGLHIGVAARGAAGIAGGLDGPGRVDARFDGGGRLGLASCAQLLKFDGADLDDHVDAVEHGAGDAAKIPVDRGLRTGGNENRELTGNYQTAKEDLAASKARVAALEEQLNASKELLKQQKQDYAALQASLDKSLTNAGDNNVNISKLVDQINESNQYIRHLVEVKSKSDSLNMVLTNNLTRSLSKEEMKEVDVQVLKGVVYISLADNMLYKSGSYEINDRAAETLSKIAKIITDYKDYEVLIEGNTDNVPVNTSAASMKNIRNNWDLSALRASSVVQALQNQYGVDPKRLTAGGRGEYNPVTTNSTEVGKQRNRRTQIIITPKLDQFMDLLDKAPENE